MARTPCGAPNCKSVGQYEQDQTGADDAVKDMIMNMTQFTKASTDLVLQMNNRLCKAKEMDDKAQEEEEGNCAKGDPVQDFFPCYGGRKCGGASCAPCLFYEDKEILLQYIDEYKNTKKYKSLPPPEQDPETNEYECRCEAFRKYIARKKLNKDSDCFCDEIEKEEEDDEDCNCNAENVGIAGKREDKISEVKKKLDMYMKKAKKYKREYLMLTGDPICQEEASDPNKSKLQRVSQRLMGSSGMMEGGNGGNGKQGSCTNKPDQFQFAAPCQYNQ